MEVREDEKGEMERAITLLLALRVPMGLEAFDAGTFSGAARRPCQILLTSTAARKQQCIIASLGFNMAFLHALACREVAEATGGKERAACLAWSPGSAM
eukprot:4306786-Pyramimonas_sp.AAC.1